MENRKLFISACIAVLSIFCFQAHCNILVHLKVFLEGPFQAGQMRTDLNPVYLPLIQPYSAAPWNYTGTEQVSFIPDPDIVDWVMVELRETPGDASQAFATNMVARRAGFLKKNGFITDLDGISPLQFNHVVQYNLFAVIHTRNHLTVLTGNPLFMNAGEYEYDFTTDAGVVYGGSTAHKELMPGIWGMVSSDANANGQVNNADKTIWLTQVGSSGYKSGDFNMNGQVGNDDKINFWMVNTGTSSQVPGAWECNAYMIDPRDGQAYMTTQIGEQCWMRQNLNYGQQLLGNQYPADNGLPEKYCYDDDISKCNQYGGLYNWNEAMQYDTIDGSQGLCPDNWHVASDAEWQILEGTVDSQYGVGSPEWNQYGFNGYDVGFLLKANMEWANQFSPDTYHFTALPGGSGVAGYSNMYSTVGNSGYFWTSTKESFWLSWSRTITVYQPQIYRANCYIDYTYSVRCIKD